MISKSVVYPHLQQRGGQPNFLIFFRETQEGCRGPGAENAGAFPKEGPIFQQPFPLPESAQALAGGFLGGVVFSGALVLPELHCETQAYTSNIKVVERGSGGIPSTGVSQRVTATGRDEPQSVPSTETLFKTRDLELLFLRDLSQVVRRTPQDTPVHFYTRTSP